MNEDGAPSLSRRAALGSSIAVLAGLMLEPGWVSAAQAQAPALKADPRYALADRLCALTIPKTDTPGASEAGVATFVLFALDQGMNGLSPALLGIVRAELDQRANGDFLAAPAADQVRVLTALDAEAYPAAPPAPRAGSPQFAWRRIKAAIVAGYYTSEIGASEELVYEPVPGAFQNITLTPDFKLRSNDGFAGDW